MQKTDDITDYAMPLINIERMAKQIHDLCLMHKYEKARELTLQLSAETRILQHTLQIMHDKEYAFANTKNIQAQPQAIQSAGRPDHARTGAHGRGGLRQANGHVGNH